VSVIMATHQAADTVGAAVESVLWQSYGDRELIVVDDGSTDRTADIVAAHTSVRLLRQENAGVAAARNHGLREATGELITFLDADDLLFEHHLAALVRMHERTGGIVTPNSFWLLPGGIHPDRKRYRGGFPRPDRQRRAILEQNFVSIMSLFHRSVVEEVGPFAEDLVRASDWEFWMRAIYGGQRVSLQPRPLALYRWGATGLSAAWDRMDEAVAAVLRRADERLPLDAEERSYVRRRLEGPDPKELSRLGDRALRLRRYAEAARLYRRAAALNATERRLVWKARVLYAAPPLAGPIVRARQLRIERQLDIRGEHVR
jgi:glycosyltransferase involved in cell wall biosynthesis